MDRRPVPDDLSAPPEPSDERALVDRARTGDLRAIDALYTLYVDRVYRFAVTRVGSAEDAEDITAEIFVRVVEALPRFQWQPDVPFRAWLFRIANNQVISHYRRAGSRPTRPIADMDFEDTQLGPERLVEQKMSVDDVCEAARKLPEAQRRVFELRFGSDLSVRETAQILNKSENNVKVLQHKALEKLKKLLGGA